MKVKDLIVQLSGCDQEAYVTDRECHGIDGIVLMEYVQEKDDGYSPVVPLVMLHAAFATDYTGE